MKKFEAQSLEEAYELAKEEYNCSITKLKIEIIQQPSKGFLGFGKKNAIIEVIHYDKIKSKPEKKHHFRKKNIHIRDISKKIEKQEVKEPAKQRKEKKIPKVYKEHPKDEIFDNFYDEGKSGVDIPKIIVKKDKQEILSEIETNINNLFSKSCYNIDKIKVEFYDENTIYIEFSGEDSALLIGKEGYRYKALSYILFNWINEKYGLMLRLEIAEFLKNQEEVMSSYLEPVIQAIKENGFYKTKPLDGVLVHIVLKRLREEFPEKYVAIKTNIKGDKYVLVNEYKKKEG